MDVGASLTKKIAYNIQSKPYVSRSWSVSHCIYLTMSCALPFANIMTGFQTLGQVANPQQRSKQGKGNWKILNAGSESVACGFKAWVNLRSGPVMTMTHHAKTTRSPCNTSMDGLWAKIMRSATAHWNVSSKTCWVARFLYDETVRMASNKNGFSARNWSSVVSGLMRTDGKCGINVYRKKSSKVRASWYFTIPRSMTSWDCSWLEWAFDSGLGTFVTPDSGIWCCWLSTRAKSWSTLASRAWTRLIHAFISIRSQATNPKNRLPYVLSLAGL